MTKTEPITGLALLRMPFPAHQISKLPKPTKAQTDAVRNDFKKGIRCQLCGAWHHPDVVHLDYVGHAALTDRLLDADPDWDWEPFAVDERGLPAFDKDGCLWIKLTVCGKTRIGVGDADGKTGGNARKEAIGDALRNAAMRFGAALDLWHKGDLHIEEETPEGGNAASKAPPREQKTPDLAQDEAFAKIAMLVHATNSSTDNICKAAKVTSIDLLSPSQADKVIEKLEAKLADMAKAKSNTLADDVDGDSVPF